MQCQCENPLCRHAIDQHVWKDEAVPCQKQAEVQVRVQKVELYLCTVCSNDLAKHLPVKYLKWVNKWDCKVD